MLVVEKDITIAEKHAWSDIQVKSGTLTIQAEAYTKHGIVSGGKLVVQSGVLRVVDALPDIPIPSALVQVYDYNTGVLVAQGYTDSSGKIKFTLMPGKYRVVVSKENYESEEQIIDITEQTTATFELEYTPDPG